MAVLEVLEARWPSSQAVQASKGLHGFISAPRALSPNASQPAYLNLLEQKLFSGERQQQQHHGLTFLPARLS